MGILPQIDDAFERDQRGHYDPATGLFRPAATASGCSCQLNSIKKYNAPLIRVYQQIVVVSAILAQELPRLSRLPPDPPASWNFDRCWPDSTAASAADIPAAQPILQAATSHPSRPLRRQACSPAMQHALPLPRITSHLRDQAPSDSSGTSTSLFKFPNDDPYLHGRYVPFYP